MVDFRDVQSRGRFEGMQSIYRNTKDNWVKLKRICDAKMVVKVQFVPFQLQSSVKKEMNKLLE